MHKTRIRNSRSLGSVQIGRDLLVMYGNGYDYEEHGNHLSIDDNYGRVTLMKSDGNRNFTPIEMPEKYREYFALCNYDGSVYVSGGYGLKTVEKLNMRLRIWEEIQPMNIARY